jgi:nucleoside-diphosphate-sugar epimerase
MRILIAGCGYVGTALGLRLADAGHTVFGLRRDPGGMPAAITPVAADLVTGDGLDRLPPDLDACVTTIAADGRASDAYHDAYVSALRNLISQVEDEITRWLFTSSTAVYRQSDGEWITEETSTSTSTFAGRALLEGEAIVLRARPVGVVLRLGGIYGPGRTRLVDQVRAGEAVIPPRPVYTNRIHRDDAAGALHHLLTLPDPDPIYLGVDHDPAERAVVLRWLAARLGAAPPPVAGPEHPPTTRGNKRARNDRLVASGYTFRYPTFREGYAAMLDHT